MSEVADYELRRELLRIDSRKSIDRLDELTRELRYLPVTTATWRATARLWDEQRRAGRITGEGLDGDVLLAAQALEEMAMVVTTKRSGPGLISGRSEQVARGSSGNAGQAGPERCPGVSG